MCYVLKWNGLQAVPKAASPTTGRLKFMGMHKTFGRVEQLKGEGWKVFVGICPECGKKHYVPVEVGRSLARDFWFAEKQQSVWWHNIKMPRVKLEW